MMDLLLLIAIVNVGIGIATAGLAARKGYDAVGGFFVGLFLGLIGLVIYACMGERQSSQARNVTRPESARIETVSLINSPEQRDTPDRDGDSRTEAYYKSHPEEFLAMRLDRISRAERDRVISPERAEEWRRRAATVDCSYADWQVIELFLGNVERIMKRGGPTESEWEQAMKILKERAQKEREAG
jgi:hypothetical protein